jgi:intracellular sulfur oxidation DsrE/DsrF family protein
MGKGAGAQFGDNGMQEETDMRRREMFRGLLATVGGLLGVRAVRAAGPEPVPDPGWPKVAYHLSDADKVGFVLGNIRNHYEGTGGKVVVALVVHGPALAALRGASASGAIVSRFAGLSRDGLAAYACGNTMKGMGIGLSDLLPGFVTAETGGVVKLAELQGQGYAYLRP